MMNFKEKPWKPTTSALRVFGKYATRNFISLDEKEARCFLAGESQSQEGNVEPGYIVVFYKEEVLGCALYSKGILHSQLPKELRIGHEEEMKM